MCEKELEEVRGGLFGELGRVVLGFTLKCLYMVQEGAKIFCLTSANCRIIYLFIPSFDEGSTIIIDISAFNKLTTQES